MNSHGGAAQGHREGHGRMTDEDESTSFRLRPPSPGGTPAQAQAPAPARDGGDPGVGRRIGGRYRLLSRLGHGGMGTVWRAKDETVDREVAVKEPRVPDHLTDGDRAKMYERMRREARAAARLDHPAVVTVHDVAVEDDRPWIVMEFVEGRSLGDVLREGTLDAPTAARIGLQVLGALEAAHQAGILHRDVKPDNVLLGRYDRVVLTDFGIAQIEGESSLTESGGFVGSPEFIAPERILGRLPGPASDLWSLGVVLYAATEGVSPFRRSNAPATLQAVLGATPAAPVAANGPLAEAINRLLDKDPARRPDAARLRLMLENAARPPQPARPPVPTVADAGTLRQTAPADGPRRPARRVWTAVGAAAVVAAVAAVLIVTNTADSSSQDPWSDHDVKELGAAVAAPKAYEESVPDADAPDDEHWATWTDPSGAIWITLSLEKHAENTSGQIAGSATAEAYADIDDVERGGSVIDGGLRADPLVRQSTVKTSYQGRESAENSVVYKTGSLNERREREARIFYYRTKSGDMYKLWIDYPAKGDFTERGRQVARTAIDRLRIAGL